MSAKENKGEPGHIAMFLDGKMIMRGPVETAIAERFQITGSYTEGEAKDLAKRLLVAEIRRGGGP